MASSRILQRYFSFDEKERRDYLVTSIILTLILFFFAWRTTDYTILSALGDIIQFFIIVLISLFLFIASSKWFAIQRHYTAHYSGWYTAALIGFVVSFTTYGWIPILFPGLIEIKRIDRLRHGKKFPGENKYDIFTILAVAPITAVIFSTILQFLYQMSGIQFFYYGMIFNAALVCFSLLPFTKNVGLHMFYTHRSHYLFFLLFGISFFILTIANLYFSAVLAAILASILWLIVRSKMTSYFPGMP